LKIIYLYQYFGTPKGSWSTRVYEMCKIWIEQGVEVTVITSPYDKLDIVANKLITKKKIDGINLIVINAGDSNRFGILKRVYRAILFAIISSYYAVKLKSDILIASSGPITIGIPGLLGKFFSKKKLVFEVRDLWPGGAVDMGLIKIGLLKKVFFKFEKICYSQSELVIPCSLGMEKDINERFQNIKTLVIPNACDNELFQQVIYDFKFPNWLNSDSKILLYTGSLGLMDACDEIIEGFNLLEEKENVHLVFIGDGTERIELESLVNKYDLNKNIHFMGLIPKTDVIEWYRKAIVSFVVFKNYYSLSTSSPNKMFDSFAAGVPIIQNTKGWIYDLVEKNRIGQNVESRNPFSMKKAIEIYTKNKIDFSELKINVLKVAKDNFDRNKLALDYLKKLNEI
jgi:glycosyltransferase involved in cell wall biosynthesis